MELIRKALAVISAGTLLGFVLYGLSKWDQFTDIWWIVAGIAIAFTVWAFAASRRGEVRYQIVERHRPNRSESTAQLDALRLRTSAYGFTAFGGAGFMLLGWSQRPEDSPISLGFPIGPTL